MRKIISFLIFLLLPIFHASADDKQGLVNWEEIFSSEAKAGFWENFLLVFKLILPYIIGLIILRIIFKLIKKKLKK